MPVKEITLEELKSDYDWEEVFGEGDGGNTDGTVEGINGCDASPVSREMVVEVLAAVNGENDEDDWLGLFRLADGRFLVAEGECDYTGWDCRACNRLTVFKTLEDAITYGLTPEQQLKLDVLAMEREYI